MGCPMPRMLALVFLPVFFVGPVGLAPAANPTTAAESSPFSVRLAMHPPFDPPDPDSQASDGGGSVPTPNDAGSDPDPDPPSQRTTFLEHALHGGDVISASHVYYGELFTNMRGGVNTNDATRYDGLYDLTLRADLDRAGFCPGGTFFLLGEEHHGGLSIAEDVGGYQVFSNIQARDFMRVSEYWWDRTYGDGTLHVRLGKQDANRLFSVVHMGTLFVRAAFQYPRMNPLPSYPDQSMGAATGVRFSEGLSFGAGVWDGRPYGGNWGFSGSGVTYSIGELRLRHKMHDTLPGDFNVGVWYNSDKWEAVAPGSTRVFEGNHGVYINAEQWIWQEPSEQSGSGKDEDKDRRRLGVFCQYAWAPPDRNTGFEYWSAGLLFAGPLPDREHDQLGVGVARQIFSPELPQRDPETAVELFYASQLHPWLTVQPDLQFIGRPDGLHRDALAFGIRFTLVL